MKCEYLSKIDIAPVPNDLNDIRLFMVVRNESLRLPYILTHYRQLGVNRFFIIDNDSTDSTQKLLLEQPDTHVFYTQQSFTMKEDWIQDMLDTYGLDRWCLVVDADELFIYPYYENVPLVKLCEFLDKMKQGAIENILVDMYPKRLISLNHYEPGDDLIQNSPYFDPYSYQRVNNVMNINKKANEPFFYSSFYGGTRKRIFGISVGCSKISLFKHTSHTYLADGMHGITGTNLSDLQGVVLHFKYLYDFMNRAVEEATREVHWKNAREYKVYANTIDSGKVNSFFNENSIKYENSSQLINLGFMKTNTKFNELLTS